MQPDFRSLGAHLRHLSEGERADIRRAFDFAVRAHGSQTREDGSPYVTHPIAVAETVAGWKADRDTIVAALLHDVLEDTAVTKEEILEHFGRHTGLLVEGITKFSQADLSPDLPLDRKVETLRKLFDVMRLDIRSVIIKLADRLHNVQTIATLPTPERRRRFAVETLAVYHKIALHLGMRDVRQVFAEQCVPEAFDDGADTQAERDRFFASAEGIPALIERDLKAAKATPHLVHLDISKRDLFTFRERRMASGREAVSDAFVAVLQVKTEDDCYRMLRLLHTLYRPVTGHFRDFVAAPSDAGYQSLHTVVALKDGMQIEVRIRTPEMDEQARQGITLWLFSGQNVPPNFAWLRRSKELDLKTRDSSEAFWEAIKTDVLSESMSVTVDGKRISLPRGSTVLDAAYGAYDAKAGSVHSATVGGKQEGLGALLHEDDDVHLTFDASEQADFDWLQMVATQHARLLIVDVLKTRDRREKITLGATLLQKEFDHYNKGAVTELGKQQRQNTAEHFRRQSFDDVLSMIGEGVIRSRDVVFQLFPDQRKVIFSRRTRGRYFFRLHVTAASHPGRDVLSLLHGIIRASDIDVTRTNVKTFDTGGRIDIIVAGSASDRLHFADFVDLLERQEWTSSISALLSRQQKLFLISSAVVALLIIGLDLLFFPLYQAYALRWSPQFVIQAIPLIPILAVNYHLLRLLRHYIVRLRSERWFLGMGLLLNIFGLATLVTRMVLAQVVYGSLLPLVAVFTASLLYVGYRFFQADALFSQPYSTAQTLRRDRFHRHTRSEKIAGYIIRLAAVVVWGFVPIYIKYTAVSTIPPMMRIFFTGVGVVLPFSIFLVIRDVTRGKRPSFRIPYDSSFWMFVVGQIAYTYLENVSLLYTSGTNLLLFISFAPVIGLFIAMLFWRRDIPYLRRPETMLWIFFLMVLSGFGSVVLIFSKTTIIGDPSRAVFGDILAILCTFFDVLLTLGQIRYIRRHPSTDGVLLNIHAFFYFLIATLPYVVIVWATGLVALPHLTPALIVQGLVIGVMFGIGLLLNYEAFKRVDGYIAYMLFNLSVVITFAFEAFIVHSIRPSLFLLVSAALIIGSSLTAEYINSRCEKRG